MRYAAQIYNINRYQNTDKSHIKSITVGNFQRNKITMKAKKIEIIWLKNMKNNLKESFIR